MVDYNIFTDNSALAEAQNRGTDKHSMVYPVEFQDPQLGDYSVKNSADAVFRLGFQNFDMYSFGVISPRLKLLAKTPRITLPIVKAVDPILSIVEWQGWRVKNLETLGERSATGMDSERGVLVISIAKIDSKIKDILHDNDVIIKFNGKVINNLSDLQNATSQVDMSKLVDIVVFRNQKETTVKVLLNKD
jgi:hypothetical protein